MKYKQLNSQHPGYDKCMYEEYNALYEGGKTFEKFKDRFLTKNEFEPPQIAKSRKDNAEYQNFIGPIIDQFAAQLYSSPFKIDSEAGNIKEIDSFYADFQNDVDGNGKDLINFMQDRFTTAVVKGCAWWVAELPPLSEELSLLKKEGRLSAEAMDQGGYNRVTLCAIDNYQVYDYQLDNYGKFLWIKLYKCESIVRDPFTSDRSTITETWKFYDAQNITTFVNVRKIDEDVDDDKEIMQKTKVSHGFAEVPVMKLEFPIGLWIMNRVASAQIGHFRTSAQLDWAQRNCAYPMPVFKSVDGTPPIIGPARFILIDKEEDFEYKAPSSDAFESLIKRIESKRVEIFRVTQQMAAGISNTAVIGRSADSKAMDGAATEICLQSYGRYVKEAVEKTLEITSNARGDVEVNFSVEGMNQFNSEDMTSTISNFTAAKTIVTHSPSFLENIEHKIIDMAFPDIDLVEKQEMHDEVSAAFVVLEAQLKPGESLVAPVESDKSSPTSEDKSKSDQSSETKL